MRSSMACALRARRAGVLAEAGHALPAASAPLQSLVCVQFGLGRVFDLARPLVAVVPGGARPIRAASGAALASGADRRRTGALGARGATGARPGSARTPPSCTCSSSDTRLRRTRRRTGRRRRHRPRRTGSSTRRRSPPRCKPRRRRPGSSRTRCSPYTGRDPASPHRWVPRPGPFAPNPPWTTHRSCFRRSCRYRWRRHPWRWRWFPNRYRPRRTLTHDPEPPPWPTGGAQEYPSHVALPPPPHPLQTIAPTAASANTSTPAWPSPVFCLVIVASGFITTSTLIHAACHGSVPVRVPGALE